MNGKMWAGLARKASYPIFGVKRSLFNNFRNMTSAVDQPEKEFTGKSVLYKVTDRVAFITLNRPERYNAIDENTPAELVKAVTLANINDDVKVTITVNYG